MAVAGAFARRSDAERPDSPPPSYGVPTRGGRMVEWPWVEERLREARHYWVATVTPRGRPHVTPIWGVFIDDDLYLEVPGVTRKARNLETNPEVQVHLEDGEQVVIVRGTARGHVPEAALATEIAAEFARKYPGYTPAAGSWDAEGLFRVEPRTLLAWHDMPTATRWRFGGSARALRSRSG